MSDSLSDRPVPSGRIVERLPKPIALADLRVQREMRHVERIFDAVGDARAVLPAIVAGEAVDREQIGVVEIDRARILVGDGEVLGVGRGDDLDARRQRLRAARELADERPAHVDRRGGDRARLPAGLALVDHRRRVGIVRAVVHVAAAERGKGHLLAERRQQPLLPLRADEGALHVLALVRVMPSVLACNVKVPSSRCSGTRNR